MNVTLLCSLSHSITVPGSFPPVTFIPDLIKSAAKKKKKTHFCYSLNFNLPENYKDAPKMAASRLLFGLNRGCGFLNDVRVELFCKRAINIF